jgi:alkylglycerol monooxygenase
MSEALTATTTTLDPAGPLNPAALMLPVFLAAIALEWWRQRKTGGYHPTTALADVSAGGVFQGLELLLHIALVPAYVAIYEHARLVSWPDGAWQPWVIGVVGVDLLFYWWHRASHVVHALWAVHGVHHQSEDFNLAVALRQPAFEPITWFVFYAPLALLGVSLEVYLVSYGFNRFYQFWVHTELVDKLGPLEWVLNTPSHHRVHHAVQGPYLDRNYGGVLIVWDRMFGTFAAEDERPLYGTTVPLRSANPVWANLRIFDDIRQRAAQGRGIGDTLRAWFGHPAWFPDGALPPAGPKRTDAGYQRYRPTPPPRATAYVLVSYLLIAALGGPFLLFEPQLPTATVVLGGLTLIVGHLGLCAVMEQRPWALAAEGLRNGLLGATLTLGLQPILGTMPAVVVGGAALLLGGVALAWLASSTSEA